MALQNVVSMADLAVRSCAERAGTAADRLGPSPAAVPCDGGRCAPRVLVVDDNLDFQEITCDMLTLLGYDVSGAADAEQALTCLSKQNYDVLLTDVSLPGMSGIRLAEKVLGQQPGIRVIFSTGYGLKALDKLGFAAGFLRKPYDLLQLKTALGETVPAPG